MKKFLKVLQGIGAVVSLSILAEPSVLIAAVPQAQQTRVAAGIAIVSAFLPELIGKKKKTQATPTAER